jgi:S1-C subfamily serine protease
MNIEKTANDRTGNGGTSRFSIRTYSDGLADLVERAGSSVVQVRGRHARPASGTVFRAGSVVMAAHALDRGNGLTVATGGRELLEAELAGVDPSTDLAVLRVPGLGAPALEPAERLRVGELAIAIGRTWSGALAASAGIVSVVGGPLRTGRGPAIEQVLRADVRIHSLGAGGALVDADGRALGIATGASMRGLPLFIPGQIAWRVADTLASAGRIRRGYLGISAQPVAIPAAQHAGRGQAAGLLVVGLASGSPAEQAGVLVGDIVVGFGGRAVQVHDDLLALLTGERVGQTLPLDVIRGGEAKEVAVLVGDTTP